MCDKEKCEKLGNHEVIFHFTTPPLKSANLALNNDSEQAIFLQKKIYMLYIKRLHVHHVKTMCFIHSYPPKCLLKSEQTRIENKMYSTLATC